MAKAPHTMGVRSGTFTPNVEVCEPCAQKGDCSFPAEVARQLNTLGSYIARSNNRCLFSRFVAPSGCEIVLATVCISPRCPSPFLDLEYATRYLALGMQYRSYKYHILSRSHPPRPHPPGNRI